MYVCVLVICMLTCSCTREVSVPVQHIHGTVICRCNKQKSLTVAMSLLHRHCFHFVTPTPFPPCYTNTVSTLLHRHCFHLATPTLFPPCYTDSSHLATPTLFPPCYTDTVSTLIHRHRFHLDTQTQFHLYTC